MNPFDPPPSSFSTIPAEKFQLVFWIDQLRSVPTLLLLLLVAAGIILLLYGQGIFRAIVIIHAVLLAGFLGRQVGLAVGQPWLLAISFAVVCGLLAWPLFKFGIAVLCGLAGVALAAQITLMFSRGPEFLPFTGLLGFILCAIGGFFLIPVAVTVFTSLEGAGLVILPLLVVAERLGLPFQKTAWLTFDRPGVLHAAILILALLGILYQTGLAKKSHPSLFPEKTTKSSG